MSDMLLLDASDDDVKPLKCVISLMCGIVTATAVAFDAGSLNYTNSLGRHFGAWYTSFIFLFDHFTNFLDLPLLTITGHLLIQAAFVILAFQWWKVPYWMSMCGAALLCRIATYHKRPVFRTKPCVLECILSLLLLIVAFVTYVAFKEGNLPPGSWVNALTEPISKRIVPMWELELDWTVYPKQLIKYLTISAVWILWWVPAVAVVEFLVAAPFIELRRNNESIQRGDDSV